MQTDFAFNTAIAAVMELTNEIYRQRDSAPPGDVRFAVATGGSLIFPFAPHLGAEVYELMTGSRVWEEPWPEADPALLERDEIQLVVQVNGKLIDRLPAPASATQEQLEELARGSDKLAARLNGGNREDCGRARQARELRGAMNARPRETHTDQALIAGGVGGVLLIVSLGLDWYGELSGFNSFEFLDLLLVLLALVTLAVLAAELGLLHTPLRSGTPLVLGVVALVVVLSQLINHPPAGIGDDVETGLWLGLAGAALMLAGADPLDCADRDRGGAADARRRPLRRRPPPRRGARAARPGADRRGRASALSAYVAVVGSGEGDWPAAEAVGRELASAARSSSAAVWAA